MKRRAGLRRYIPARRQAARGRREAQAERAGRYARSSGARRARRFLSRRRRPRDRRRPGKIGSPVTRDDLENYRASIAEPLSVRLNAGTLYNTPPPTQGLASLIILALYERLRVARGRELRIRPWHGRGDQARVPRARPRRHRSGANRRRPPRIPRPTFLDAEVGEDRSAQGGEMAGALRRRRHHLDGRGGLRRARGLLHPVALLGVRLRLRAAEDRRR